MKNSSDYDTQVNEYVRAVLRERLGISQRLKIDLAEELNMSPGTLYKKLSGDSIFSLGEVAYLASKYEFSLDALVNSNNKRAIITHSAEDTPIRYPGDYLERVLKFTRLANSVPQCRIHYITHELPIFFYLLNPKVAYFKLFHYARTVWHIPEFNSRTMFDFKLFDDSYIVLIEKLWHSYAQLNTIEIWNPSILDNTFNQLLFMVDAKLFTKKQIALEILDGITELVKKIESMILQKQKFGSIVDGSFLVYNNSTIFTNNIILLKSPTYNMTFMVHDNPNFFFTNDEQIFSNSLKWSDQIRDNSYSLHEGSGHNMSSFIGTLFYKIDQVRRKIKNTRSISGRY